MSDDALAGEVLAHLSGMERMSTRRMFGGIGLYAGARLFGIVWKGTLYLRADDGMRRSLARDGGGAFRPYRGRVVTAYWALPAAVLSDKRRIRAWTRRAIAACDAAGPRTPGRPKRAPKRLVLKPPRLRC
ncbi:MAG TPA: TfoX/Sxy family protein [Kofleriaceae bacterium]|nr:TfoX/Sxy family protein [Kofleriaceae bacterium]